jgi:NAD-dependent dihydropyrimidine dehydrogenase PreA subunit
MTPSKKTPVVLSKYRAATTAQQNLEQEVARRLAKLPGLEVTAVPHLYDLGADGQAMDLLRSVPGDMVVLSWLYPRSAFWVLDANRVRGRLGRTSSLGSDELDEPLAPSRDRGETPDRTIWCFDFRTHGRPEPFVEEIARLTGQAVEPPPAEETVLAAGGNGRLREIDEPIRFRWYPVVDYSRCQNCLECLNFCLFGVFGIDEQERLLIEQPDACRPGCPACARICPSGAIMFPQHLDPAIAGDPKAPREAPKPDLTQISFLGPADQAAAERARALAERQSHAAQPPKDDLDRLIDKLDASEP